MKRILSVIMAAVMVLSLIPAMVFVSYAEDAFPTGTLLVRTAGVDQTWRSATAGEKVSFLGENGIDAGNKTKPSGLHQNAQNYWNNGVDDASNGVKVKGQTWMSNNSVWAYGYAIEVKGAEGPVVANIHPVVWTEKEDHTGGWMRGDAKGDHTITIPGNGVYPLLLNGSCMIGGTNTEQYKIAWAAVFDVTFDTDVEYRVLSEVETAGTFTDMSTIKADVPYSYVGTDGETVNTSVNVAKGYANDGLGNGKYTANKIAPEALASVVNGDTKYVFEGWTTDENSVSAEDVSLLGTSGLVSTLYPIWKTIPNVEEPAQSEYYFDLNAAPVRVPTVAEGLESQNGVTLWEGSEVDFGETGAPIVTFVIKATGINTPVSLSRFLPTFTMQNKIDYWAINNTWGSGNAGLDGVGTESPFALNIPKDGTYVISIGRKAFGMGSAGRVLTISSLKVADINNSYKGKYPLVNDNENAQISLLSVSAGNPTFTANFYSADGELLGSAKKEYPKASEDSDNNTGKKSTCLTVDDMFALTGAALPTKVADDKYTYVLQWVDGNGNPVDAVYKNMNVFASFVPVLASQARVTFLDATGNVMQSGLVDKGTNPVCADPTKNSTDDATYTFKGWTVDGENIVDLATYVVDGDVTFTPVFVEDIITKAILVETSPVKFGGSGKFAIKLNRTDVTLDVIEGSKAPIAEGTITVVTDGLTNDGRTEFTVPFDTIDENGLTNAEFTLDSVENVSTSYTVTISGTVMTEDLDEASITANSSTVAVIGQQLGEFYGDGEGTSFNKNVTVVDEEGNETVKLPDSQLIWSGNVNTGKSDGVTFVYKLDGITTPIVADNFNIRYNNSSLYSWNSWNWQNGGNTGGMISRKQTFNENGYFYMYVNQIPNGANKYDSVNGFEIFTNPGSFEGSTRTNTNENATLRMLAVVADNLQPSLIFCDENGAEISRETYKYTEITGQCWSSKAKSEGSLITVGDFLAMSNVQAPAKASDDANTYVFDKWLLADGTEIDEKAPFYMNVELVPSYTAVPKTTKYEVTFDSDGATVDTQSVWENEYAIAPTAPAKADDATGYFTFEGWSLDGKNVVDVATEAIKADTTFKAVFSHTNVEFTVTYVSGKNDKNEDIVFNTEKVVRSKDAAFSGTPKYATDAYKANESGEPEAAYYHRFVRWVDADGNEAVRTNIQSDVKVYAEVEDVLVENWYKVTWQEEDGKVLDSKMVADGDGTSTGVKGIMNGKADENSWYKQTGWSVPTAEITADTVVNPVYDTSEKVDVSSVHTTYNATGLVKDKLVIFGGDIGAYTFKSYKEWNPIAVLIKLEGASEANPVTVGGLRTTGFGGIDSNNSGNYSETKPLIDAAAQDGYYYANIGGAVLTWSQNAKSIGSLAISDPGSTRGGKSSDASGEAKMTVTFIEGFFTPTVRFYDANGNWLATNKLTTTSNNWSYETNKVAPTLDSMYNGAELGENFLYWADADGNEVKQLYDSMDVHAVYDVPEYVIGDVNCDGNINGDDVFDLSRYVAKWQGATLGSELAADVNCDGNINGDDVSDLSRYVAKWQGATLG